MKPNGEQEAIGAKWKKTVGELDKRIENEVFHEPHNKKVFLTFSRLARLPIKLLLITDF